MVTTLFYEHFVSLVALPMIALTAFCVVLTLRVVEGNVELEITSLIKLKGAAGPILLWVVVFLAGAFAHWLLWDKGFHLPS